MHRHRQPSLIHLLTDMPFLLRTRKALYLLGFCAVLVTAVSAEESKTAPLLTATSSTTISGYVDSSASTGSGGVASKSLSGDYVTPLGGETLLLGNVRGDQVWPALSISARGGYITWEDNGIDRVGAGIGARHFLDSSLTVAPTSFTVNRVATGDQITPQVACLTNNSAVFVWQSMVAGTPDVWARLMKSNGVFATIDLRVNTYIKDAQSHPAVAALADGGAVIVWQSAWQDGCPWGVYMRKMVPTCALTPVREVEVNQFKEVSAPYRSERNGRHNPAVALLANGNFVVVWVSEGQVPVVFPNIAVNLFGRIYAPNLTPLTDEFRIDATTNVCADPQVAALSDGGFSVVWSQRDFHDRNNSWDIVGRSFMSDGTAKGDQFFVNTFRFGDQFQPKIASGPNGCLVVWTSMGQDGSREGVFGQFLLGGSQLAGPEIMVNTTRISQQLQPAVAWNGVDRFLVVWSGMVAQYGFDLFGQSYSLSSP